MLNFSLFLLIRLFFFVFTLVGKEVPQIVHLRVDLLTGPNDIFSTRIQLVGSLNCGHRLSANMLALVQDFLHLLVLASLLVEEQLFQSLAWF